MKRPWFWRESPSDRLEPAHFERRAATCPANALGAELVRMLIQTRVEPSSSRRRSAIGRSTPPMGPDLKSVSVDAALVIGEVVAAPRTLHIGYVQIDHDRFIHTLRDGKICVAKAQGDGRSVFAACAKAGPCLDPTGALDGASSRAAGDSLIRPRAWSSTVPTPRRQAPMLSPTTSANQSSRRQ